MFFSVMSRLETARRDGTTRMPLEFMQWLIALTTIGAWLLLSRGG